MSSHFQVPDTVFCLHLRSRAFVEFSRNPTERFKTLPAVYMAIKMSQLKVSLELSVHSAEEIEGKVQGGTVSKLRNTRYCPQVLSPGTVPRAWAPLHTSSRFSASRAEN